MGTKERFHALEQHQQLAVAAAAAGRVLPIYSHVVERSSGVFEDGLRLVWLELEGQRVTRQDYARVLNAAIGMVPPAGEEAHAAARHAGAATISVLEGAQHNPEALLDAMKSAVHAVEAFAGSDAGSEESRWQTWAIVRAAEQPRPGRDSFGGEGAPASTWLDDVSARDLPLLQRPR